MLVKDSAEMLANHAGAVVGFQTQRGEKVGLRVASSFISYEQAELNLQREIGRDAFEVTTKKSERFVESPVGKDIR